MKNQIPKVIHYCWFGHNPLPEEAKKFIKTWKKYCPDYEIKEWNETNFDINSNTYVKEAYESKKWAFVTDYVRLYVLYNEGGVYMDTDVELLKPIDDYLKHEAFSGFESSNDIPTGIMASKKKFRLFKEFLDYYKDRHFILPDGSLDLKTNVETMTEICKKYGLKSNNKYQEINGWALYPSEVFCPKNCHTGEINITDKTVTIHHFAGSWLASDKHERTALLYKLSKKFGVKTGTFLFRTVFIPYRLLSYLKSHGVKRTIHHLFHLKEDQ